MEGGEPWIGVGLDGAGQVEVGTGRLQFQCVKGAAMGINSMLGKRFDAVARGLVEESSEQIAAASTSVACRADLT